MKSELSDNGLYAINIVTFILCASVATMFGCHSSEKTKQEAIKAGLHQSQSYGTNWPLWTK